MVTFQSEDDCAFWMNIVMFLVENGTNAADAVGTADTLVLQNHNRRIDLDQKPEMKEISSEAFTEAFGEKAKQAEEILRDRFNKIHFAKD